MTERARPCPTMVDQREFDFGAPRQARIASALRATSQRVRRAVPLSDVDRLMLLCMRELAQKIADETRGLPLHAAQAFTSRRVTEIVGALDEVSEAFALETARYLTETVHTLRAGESKKSNRDSV